MVSTTSTFLVANQRSAATFAELIDVVYPKARITEISSNGLRPERLLPIIKKYPNMKVRFSLEGDEATNNAIRGEKNGFATKIAGLRKLREAGGTDLGFAMVIQDENADQLVRVYEMARAEGVELATSTLAQRVAVLQER